MIAKNGWEWMRQRPKSMVNESLLDLGKAEVTLVEWADGSLWWAAGMSLEESDSKPLWTIQQVQLLEEGRIRFELLAAEDPAKLKRLLKLVKLIGAPEAFELQTWESQERTLEYYAKEQGLAELTWPNYATCSPAEQIEVWADSFCTRGSLRERQIVDPEISSFGIWSDGDRYTTLGKLSWLPTCESGIKKQWLQRLEQRLRLLGLEWETVLCGRGGAKPSGTEAAMLQRLCKDMAIYPKISTAYDATHSIPQDIGTMLVWRALDPVGASWPVAFVGIAEEAKRKWVKGQKKLKDDSSCAATVRWLQGAHWWCGSEYADLTTEVWLRDARDKVNRDGVGKSISLKSDSNRQTKGN